jgi:DNA-binding transcriptional ArsR family regulator
MPPEPGWMRDGATAAADGAKARGSLAALLGRTRAAVLEAAVLGCTTGELSRRLDISPASASEHTAVLRKARLLTSRRNGPAVHHRPTPLGLTLLGEVGGP